MRFSSHGVSTTQTHIHVRTTRMHARTTRVHLKALVPRDGARGAHLLQYG